MKFKKAIGVVKLSDTTFSNPTVFIVKKLLSQLFQDEKAALKAKQCQEPRVSIIGESLIETLGDDELTYAIESNENIKRLQE